MENGIVPESAVAHHSVGQLCIAKCLADNVGLQRYLALAAHLGTTGIDQHIYHKIRRISLQFPLKNLCITASSKPPQP